MIIIKGFYLGGVMCSQLLIQRYYSILESPSTFMVSSSVSLQFRVNIRGRGFYDNYYGILLRWCYVQLAFDLVLLQYSREPFITTCRIETSSPAFVRATRTFTIGQVGFIRGGQRFTCLMTTSWYFLLQRICSEECDLYNRLLSFHVLHIMKSLSNKKIH